MIVSFGYMTKLIKKRKRRRERERETKNQFQQVAKIQNDS
jgi:hypothetical protein